MIGESYKKRLFYYKIMKNFISEKINAWQFRQKFWAQRSNDVHEDSKTGYTDFYLNRKLEGNIKTFEKEYSDPLYNSIWTNQTSVFLKKYEEGAIKYNIKGEMFFMGLYTFVDPYIREYYPSNKEGFDPKENVNEETLKEKIQDVYNVLKRNEDRWM